MSSGHESPVRIVVTGSESTGKTTLAKQLSQSLGAMCVPEYSRIYAESIGRPLTADDVSPIAEGQIKLEDDALETAPPIIVQDTDLLSTVAYARHYYGDCPPWIVAAATRRLGSLYLLCDIDLPWIHDGVRDRPLDRELLDLLFRTVLAEFGATVSPVSGLGEVRLQTALDCVRAWVATR